MFDVNRLLSDDFIVELPFRMEGSDEVVVKIRHIPMDELSEIARKATVTTFRNHQKTVDTDVREHNRLIGRAGVRGWRGFVNGGEEWPYSPENCDLLMSRFFDFCAFVNAAVSDVGRLYKADRDALEKN